MAFVAVKLGKEGTGWKLGKARSRNRVGKWRGRRGEEGKSRGGSLLAMTLGKRFSGSSAEDNQVNELGASVGLVRSDSGHNRKARQSGSAAGRGDRANHCSILLRCFLANMPRRLDGHKPEVSDIAS